MLKTAIVTTSIVLGAWTYVVHPETGVVLRAQQTPDRGNAIIVTFPAKDPLPIIQNGLPTTKMKVTVTPIDRVALEPYLLKALAAQAQKALDEGDMKKAQELLRQLQGLQAQPAEDTQSTTPTGGEGETQTPSAGHDDS